MSLKVTHLSLVRFGLIALPFWRGLLMFLLFRDACSAALVSADPVGCAGCVQIVDEAGKQTAPSTSP
jgi:hypothetical protein